MNTLQRLRHAVRFIGRGGFTAVSGNLSLAVISLALALSLWLYVNDQENPKQTETFNSAVPIKFVNVPNGLAVANTSETSVRVQVAATKNDIKKLRVEDLSATADLGGYQEGVQSVVVDVKPSNSSIDVTDVTPLHVDVTLDNVITKEVPVSVSLVGVPRIGFAAGTSAGDQIADPTTVTVSGPESLVTLVSSAVAEVNLTNRRVDVDDERTELKPQDARGGEINRVTVNPNSARVTVKIVQVTSSREFAVVPTIRGAPASGYNITSVTVDPSAVSVSASKEILQDIDAVKGIATDEVSVADQRGDVVRQVQLTLPKGATVGDDPAPKVTVRVTIAPARGEFSYGVVPQLRNVPSGLVATLAQPIVVVTLAGELPALQSLPPESITTTVDAEGLNAGLYSLPLQITAPPGTTVVRTDPQQIGVAIGPQP